MGFLRSTPMKSTAIFFLVLLFAGCSVRKEIARVDDVKGGQSFLVAVLPVENLSGRPAPLREIRQMLAEGLKNRGIGVLADGDLERFMARHRMRYTGGIDKELTKALLQETGTKAVLITSVEYFTETVPPKFSFSTRLVSTGDRPDVLWMKTLGIAGDDHPGILGLGLIGKPKEIQGKAVNEALDPLARSVQEGMTRLSIHEKAGRRFQPKRYYRSPEIVVGEGKILTVAVLPFLNGSSRKNAGEVMTLHFVSRLAQSGTVRVIEPGMVRQELLRLRIIMQDGLSIPQADLLFDMLDADLFVTGNVSEYQDFEGPAGPAKVGFSVLVFDRKSKQVIWSSRSDNSGNDGVFFFDVGEVKTAAALAVEMTRAVVERIVGKG